MKPEEKKQIEARIQAAEAKTSGEIVVSIVRASGDYQWVHLAAAGVGWAVVSAALGAQAYRGWGFPVITLLGWQAVGAGIGAIASLYPPVARLFLSPRARAVHVHHECLAHFTALGIHETHERTGILIFVSELERRVEILADSGIHERAGADYWREQVEGIVQGIRAGNPTQGLCQAIDRIADKLAAHYPPHEKPTNELSNEVHEGSRLPGDT
jgi:putative membrane protein